MEHSLLRFAVLELTKLANQQPQGLEETGRNTATRSLQCNSQQGLKKQEPPGLFENKATQGLQGQELQWLGKNHKSATAFYHPEAVGHFSLVI